jgi:hypothetical protein
MGAPPASPATVLTGAAGAPSGGGGGVARCAADITAGQQEAGQLHQQLLLQGRQ